MSTLPLPSKVATPLLAAFSDFRIRVLSPMIILLLPSKLIPLMVLGIYSVFEVFAFPVKSPVKFGELTIPVKFGEAKFAFNASAKLPAVLIGLFASVVLFTFSKLKTVLAAKGVIAPVPPFSIARIPEIFTAFPDILPIIFEALTVAIF